MGALDGFYSTWNKAKATFGVGVPTDGTQYDGSSQLLRMKATIESAEPDDRWQGSGSEAYAAANKEHASVYQKLADLDKQLSAEVSYAADVVTSGRANLDDTKSWVDDLVRSLPPGNAQDRDSHLVSIARAGIAKVDHIVQNANTEMSAIAERVTGLKGDFDALRNQKFASGTDSTDGTNGT
ncbi:EspA/EspE family type VII secretion system effector [Mycolicibacterium sp. HK-90]|uniref:EspA/EspE family type VII secretion system effector n=1 Tax=Mycolicibacterium sp. HK-90 TaxID=3056937 RepID=UPI00265A6106|nr:EspA/EspE family type VII secretion system effector [Mycolicibacterium sp. HK-90]WKG03020.1 EspA/EspE family type VII secretion system effector [Mycolicibacterium sp. HK-90]